MLADAREPLCDGLRIFFHLQQGVHASMRARLLPSSRQPKTLGSRFLLLFSAVTLPLLGLLFLAGNYSKQVVLTQVANSYQNLVNSNLGMIDKSLDDIASTMVNMVDHDENFSKFGQPGLSDSDYYFARMDLMRKYTSYQSYYHTVDMFYIYSVPNDTIASSFLSGVSEREYDAARSWAERMLHLPEERRGYLYKWNIVSIGGQFYLHRLVSDDISNNAFAGALININTLKLPLGDLDLREGGDVHFVAGDGNLLSDASRTLGEGFRLPADKLGMNASFTFRDGGKKLFVITGQSPRHPVRMAVILPYSELLRGLNRFQALVNLLPLAVLAILLIYAYMFRKMLFYPISRLLIAIRRIGEGDMEIRLERSPIAEFDTINHTFNHMAEEIRDLKIDVYEEKLNAQKAELKHLQTQINPHFFLNTLNVVYQLADLNRSELVKKTVRHMVQYFRFMLDTRRGMITLGQEMEHIRNYLEIQKMRYQDSFSFRIDISGGLSGAKLPALSVQPFVENAMIHGMSVKSEPFMLEITAITEPERPGLMRIEVADNGKGMTEELMQSLNSAGYAPDSAEGHVGVWNVKQRLAMHYKEAAKVEFGVHEPKGVRVVIGLPFQHDQGGGDNV